MTGTVLLILAAITLLFSGTKKDDKSGRRYIPFLHLLLAVLLVTKALGAPFLQ